MKYLVVLEISAKAIDNGEFPSINDVVEHVTMVLGNDTANNKRLGWFVRKVERIHGTDLLT